MSPQGDGENKIDESKSNPKFKAAQVIAALRASKGLVTVAADHLGCNPQTIRNYAKRHPTVAAALLEERERTVDLAESGLMVCLTLKQGWAIALVLKTLGKNRGYVERTEIVTDGIDPQRERLVNEIILASQGGPGAVDKLLRKLEQDDLDLDDSEVEEDPGEDAIG